MTKNFTETVKEIENLQKAIERAEKAGDFEKARELTEELLELDNALGMPTNEDVLEWQGYYNS